MTHTQWIYVLNPWIVLLLTFAILFSASYFAHHLGRTIQSRAVQSNRFFLSDFVPSTILGLLALILGFTFSMTISRFEHRRELAVSEANAIGTTLLRSSLLRPPHSTQMKNLLLRYLDSRIEHYELYLNKERLPMMDSNLVQLEREIWSVIENAAKTDRGAIESIFVNSLNSTFDLANERDIALNKTLPAVIYWAILLISCTGLMAFNFARGERNELGQWQSSILVFLISFVFYLILDIDRPREGLIQISQDAMTSLRDEWK